MRRIALAFAVVVVIGGCGPSGSEESSPGPSSSTTTSAPAVPGAAFPEDIPTDSDGECSLPRTDPARPKAGPLGKITDGVEVSQVDVSDGGPDSVIVDFTVSAPPYVNATSGERWVVITLDGVRRFGHVANIMSSHVRRLPATICDDSSWAFAFAFDREIDRLELENEAAPRLRVFLKS